MEDIIFKLNEYIERDIDLLINIFMPRYLSLYFFKLVI